MCDLPPDRARRRCTARLGATMTDFAGWDMPLRYASERDEHQAVRTRGRTVRPLPHG